MNLFNTAVALQEPLAMLVGGAIARRGGGWTSVGVAISSSPGLSSHFIINCSASNASMSRW